MARVQQLVPVVRTPLRKRSKEAQVQPNNRWVRPHNALSSPVALYDGDFSTTKGLKAVRLAQADFEITDLLARL